MQRRHQQRREEPRKFDYLLKPIPTFGRDFDRLDWSMGILDVPAQPSGLRRL
jgi:hypothetical protein